MASSTPGPWRLSAMQETDKGRTWHINGNAECGMAQPQDCLLAQVYSIEANARLMNAAPDLLEACRGLASLAYSLMNPAQLPWAYHDAVAAIAKAEGR